MSDWTEGFKLGVKTAHEQMLCKTSVERACDGYFRCREDLGSLTWAKIPESTKRHIRPWFRAAIKATINEPNNLNREGDPNAPKAGV